METKSPPLSERLHTNLYRGLHKCAQIAGLICPSHAESRAKVVKALCLPKEGSTARESVAGQGRACEPTNERP